jgi:hypothetical protein
MGKPIPTVQPPKETWTAFQWGCTCGQCQEGWLSVRMKFCLHCMITLPLPLFSLFFFPSIYLIFYFFFHHLFHFSFDSVFHPLSQIFPMCVYTFLNKKSGNAEVASDMVIEREFSAHIIISKDDLFMTAMSDYIPGDIQRAGIYPSYLKGYSLVFGAIARVLDEKVFMKGFSLLLILLFFFFSLFLPFLLLFFSFFPFSSLSILPSPSSPSPLLFSFLSFSSPLLLSLLLLSSSPSPPSLLLLFTFSSPSRLQFLVFIGQTVTLKRKYRHANLLHRILKVQNTTNNT